MSSEDIAYQEGLPVPRHRARPAYGEVASPPPAAAEPENETPELLNRRMEGILALLIVTPVLAAYGGIAYAFYLASDAIF
jgi:hypothetical protein